MSDITPFRHIPGQLGTGHMVPNTLFDDLNLVNPSFWGYWGSLKRWNGTNWALVPLKYYDGFNFVPKPLFRWDGNDWVMINSLGEVESPIVQPVVESIMDSYDANANGDQIQRLSSVDNQGIAQSFTGDGRKITKAIVSLRSYASPTGTVVCKIYAHSGTFGTSSVPGTLIATSNTIDVSTIPNVLGSYTFTFATQPVTVAGTKYVFSVEYGAGDATNQIGLVCDVSSPTHSGNISYLVSLAWSANSTQDMCFELYGL